MYLESSKDILNLSLAVSVFGIAFLVGWILVYAIIIIRRLVRLLSGIEERMRKLDTFFEAVRDKLEHSASYLSLLSTAVRELVSYLIERRAKSSARSRKAPVL